MEWLFILGKETLLALICGHGGTYVGSLGVKDPLRLAWLALRWLFGLLLIIEVIVCGQKFVHKALVFRIQILHFIQLLCQF